MNFERASRDEQKVDQVDSATDESPWGESYTNDLPPFTPEQNKIDERPASERAIAERMVKILDERQDTLVDWLNRANHDEIYGDTAAGDEYEKFLRENHLADTTEATKLWSDSLSSQLDRLQTRGDYAITALEELDSPKNANRSIEDVFIDKANQTQAHIERLAQSGAWNKMSEEQQKSLLERRDEYQILAEWAPYIRKELDGDDETDVTNSSEGKTEEKVTEIDERLDLQPNGSAGDSESLQDELMSNSETEVREILGLLESMQPDARQLFAMSRGSLSAEQAAGYLLTSNQNMSELSAEYANVLQKGRSFAEIKQFAAAYNTEMNTNYTHTTNAIKVIRDKAQTLPNNLRGPMLFYCQNIENTLASIMTIIKQKDNQTHNTPIEKLKTDDQELRETIEEEMSM